MRRYGDFIDPWSSGELNQRARARFGDSVSYFKALVRHVFSHLFHSLPVKQKIRAASFHVFFIRCARTEFSKLYNSMKNWRSDMRQRLIFCVLRSADAYVKYMYSYHDTCIRIYTIRLEGKRSIIRYKERFFFIF